MDTDLTPDQLAAMCFHRLPADIVARDVVLAALFQLNIRAVRVNLANRTFRHTLVGQASGLPHGPFRIAIAELLAEGLIFRNRNSYALTSAGHRALPDLVDIDRVLELERPAPSRSHHPHPQASS